jgi:hypothetical protein
MRRIPLILTAGALLIGYSAQAEVSEEEFNELKDQYAELAAKVDGKSASSKEGSSWTDRISMNGDFRFRYENIDVEGKDDRNRSRIRARVNVIGNLPQNVEVGVGLATGGDDPVSTNQTLGSGGSSKDIRLNLAYADWAPVDGLHLVVGKFKNRLVRVAKNGLMWDGDWTPEGMAITYEKGWFFGNALGSWLESDSKTGNDEFSWGGQVGVQFEPAGIKLKGGVGYYAFKTAGSSGFFGDPSDPDDYFGNSVVGPTCGDVDGICTYEFDYEMTEVFGEAGFDLFGSPAVVFFDFVNNSDPDENDTAWSVGTRIGKTKKDGDMQFSYWYADKEADALFGLLTDSDFGGGGTDNKGHFLKFAYAMNKSWVLDVQYFINEIDVSTNETDYNRLMLSTAWKFK